jgi:hypothetical protein
MLHNWTSAPHYTGMPSTPLGSNSTKQRRYAGLRVLFMQLLALPCFFVYFALGIDNALPKTPACALQGGMSACGHPAFHAASSRCGGADGRELDLPGEGCPSKLASLSSLVMRRPAACWLAATTETGFCMLLEASV